MSLLSIVDAQLAQIFHAMRVAAFEIGGRKECAIIGKEQCTNIDVRTTHRGKCRSMTQRIIGA